MNFKAIFFIGVLFFNFLFAITSTQSTNTILVVNSKDWKDVLAGGVYAAQLKYSYLFILTPEQANYLVSLFKNDAKSTIFYYEANEPVVEDFVIKLKQEVPRAKLNKQENLASFFASTSTQKKAIVVSSDDVENALSAASYAALSGSSLHFASKDNLESLVSGLLEKKNSVLLYGNIAAIATNLENVEKINTGSIYINNLELLKRLQAQGYEINQVVFASGRTFEDSILNNPIALVGRTEPTKDLIDWIRSNQAQGKLKQGLVYAGDADIEGAIRTIKKETGLAVFTKFATGFSTDSEAKPNLVLELPAKNVVLQLYPPVYDYATSTLSLEVINLGNTNAYVRIVAQLPNGKFVGSEQKKLEPMEIVLFSVSLSSAGLDGEDIEKAILNVYSSKEEKFVENIDVVEFKNVKYINKPTAQSKPTQQPPQNQQVPRSEPPTSQPAPTSASSSQGLGYDFYSWAFVAVIIIVLIAVYLYSSKQIQGKIFKDKEKQKTKKA